jgi:hypothetical protein
VTGTPLFRSRAGLLFRPWITFPQAPVVIPDGRFSRVRLAGLAVPYGLPGVREAQAPTRIHPSGLQLSLRSARPPILRRSWAQSPTPVRSDVSAKSESPFAFLERYPSKGDVLHHLGGHCPTVFAPTGSCARSFVLLSASLSGSSFRSLPVAVGPGWTPILPDLISTIPSPNVWPPIPAGPEVHLLVSSLGTTAFPTLGTGRLPATSRTATSVRT